MILALVAITAERLLRSRLVALSFAQTVIQQEQARLMALSGLQYACALLEYDKDKKEEQDQKKEESPEQRYLKRIVPLLNRWQYYTFSTVQEGGATAGDFVGEFRICIVSENGKFNINEAFDFKKGEFKQEYEALLKQLAVTGLPEGALFSRLTSYLRKRKGKLDDIAQLQEIEGLKGLKLFYEPPVQAPEGEKNKSNEQLALADLFTIWTSGESVHPLLFSDSLCAVFSMQRPRADDLKTMKEQFSTVITEWQSARQGDWKVLEPIYGELPEYFKKFERLFSKQFGTPVYSVVSCGRVGNIEQRVMAIIGRDTKRSKKPDAQQGEKKKRSVDYFRVIKAYWQ